MNKKQETYSKKILVESNSTYQVARLFVRVRDVGLETVGLTLGAAGQPEEKVALDVRESATYKVGDTLFRVRLLKTPRHRGDGTVSGFVAELLVSKEPISR